MIYKGDNLREISFPIGGIGTGSFGIAGNGSFVDWEIFNRPNKGSVLDNAHIAVKAKWSGGEVVKILNGDLVKDLTGTLGKPAFSGFGVGPSTGTMCGISHFKECTFKGEFPIAELTFFDDSFPGEVVLTVFNPFIPLDSFNSSIPAGFFDIKFNNTTEREIEYSAVFSMANPFENSVNEEIVADGYHILKLFSDIDQNEKKYGDISVLTASGDTEVQTYWYRGEWNDNLDVFIRQLYENDRLPQRVYTEKKTTPKQDVGSVAVHKKIAESSTDSIRFVLSWNVPNNYNYWSRNSDGKQWKNYYATVFETSVESAKYSYKNFQDLMDKTVELKNALFGCSLPETVIDAVSSTLSVLKSATVLRLEDGSFYGWEGVHEKEGSCEGTCQHVWNYAYALCFLFPDLERSIRDNEFNYCTHKNGRTVFRMQLPRDREKSSWLPCVDGQMGTVIKTYREWKISGDDEWLKRVWPTVKTVLEYAWHEENYCKWDSNKDGVLEGHQHHTLDMELFGPSSWLQGFYLGALKAASIMAEYLGDTAAAEYCEIFEKGYAWTKGNLFNGEYFIHKIDLNDRSVTDEFNVSNRYWYEEKQEIKYQIAEGCEIDQLLGQWHANILGLGDLFDKEQVKIALKSLYKYNFKPSMREFNNTWRVFSLNDEAGAVICEYPKAKPTIPLPYHAETMTGFEYSLAGLLISEGFVEEGLNIVKAVRDRYDGKKRNPWNEIECGSNYARAMSSFALLPIISGFKFDLPHKKIGFKPVLKGKFNCLFSVGTGWGVLDWSDGEVKITLKAGYLDLTELEIPVNPKAVIIDGNAVDFQRTDNGVEFATTKVTQGITVEIKSEE